NKVEVTDRNLAAANADIRALAEKLQPVGVRQPSTHDPATAHLPNAPPAADTPALRNHTSGQLRQPPPIPTRGDELIADPVGTTTIGMPNPVLPPQVPAPAFQVTPSPPADISGADAGTPLAELPGAEVGQPQEPARASTDDPAGVRAVQQGDPAETPAVRQGDPVGVPAARQGDPVAAESLVRIHWPAALAQSATHVGWDTTSVAPPEVVRQLAHAMTFAGFRAAAMEGWLLPEAQDLGDRLREKTGDALLDGMGQLNAAERNAVADVLRAPSGEQQPTEHQIDVLERLIRAVHALHRADESPDTGVQLSTVVRSSSASAGDPTVTPRSAEAADPAGTTTPELLGAADSAVRAAASAVAATEPVSGRAEDIAAPPGMIGAATASVAVPNPDPNSTRDLRALRLGVVAAYKKLEGATDADPVVAALAASPLELFGRFVDQLYPSQRTALTLRFRQGLTEDQVAYVHNARATTEPHWTATTVGTLAAGGLRRLARTIAAEQGIPGAGPALATTELAVLEATARGLPRAVIARRLNLPRRTLAAVTRQTSQKLGVANRAASVAEAVRRGELDPTVFPAPENLAAVRLSERQSAVLVLTAKGRTPAAVAAALSISPTDVHTHLGDIGRVLGTHIPAAMVAAGIRSGVLEVNGTRWSQWDRTDGETAADEPQASPPAVITADGTPGTPTPVDPAVLGAPAVASRDRAGAGEVSVAQALNQRYGRNNVGRIVAMLGWDPARGTPPTRLARLAHAIHFRAVASADDDRRPVPAGRSVADWLFEIAQNTVLECLGFVSVQDRRTIGAAINGLHRGEDPTAEQLAAIQRLAAAAQQRSRPGGPEDRADTTAGRTTVSPAPKPFVGADTAYAEPGVAAPVGGFDPALVTAVDPGAPIGSHTVIGRGGSGDRNTGAAASPRTEDGRTSPVVPVDRALSEAVAHIVCLVGGLAPAAGMAPDRILAALLGLTAEQAAGILLRVNSALADTTDAPPESPEQAGLLTGRLQLSPTQVEILRLLAEDLPGGTGRTTTVPPDTLRAFRHRVANLPGAALGRPETEVLHLFMQGHSAESAAAALDLSPDIVSGYLTSAEHELRSRGVIPTVLAALRAGVLDSDNALYEAVELSEIEIRALRAVAAGMTDDVIGAELGVGTRRRRRLMAELYDKFGVDSKLGLALAAHRHRLLEEVEPDTGPERASREAEVPPADTEPTGTPITSPGRVAGTEGADLSIGDEARPSGTTRQVPRPEGYDLIGDWLEAVRLHRELDRFELAERMQVRPARVRAAETGTTPRLIYLRLFRDALNIPNEILVAALEKFYSRPDIRVRNRAEEELFWALIATVPGSDEESEIRNQIFSAYEWMPKVALRGWIHLGPDERNDRISTVTEKILRATGNFVPPGCFGPVAWSHARYAVSRAYHQGRYPLANQEELNKILRINAYINRISARTGNEPGDAEIAAALGMTLEKLAYIRGLMEARVLNSVGRIENLSDDGPRGSGSSTITNRLIKNALHRALAGFPDPRTAAGIVELHFIDGLTPRQVGEHLSIPVEAVEELIPRIRAALYANLPDPDAEAGTSADDAPAERNPGAITPKTPSIERLTAQLVADAARVGWLKSVSDTLRTAIRAGALAPGAALPSAREFAAQIGLSGPDEVSRAYRKLAGEGYLVSKRSVGTTVTPREQWPASVSPNDGRPLSPAELLATFTVATSPKSAADNASRFGWQRTIVAELRRAVRSGRLPEGQLLPTAAELTRYLGLSSGTSVGKAYRELAAEGYVVTKQGARASVAGRDSWPAAVNSLLDRAAATESGDTTSWKRYFAAALPESPALNEVTESERQVKQAIAADIFLGYGIEVLGLEKLSIEMAMSVRRAVRDEMVEADAVRPDAIAVVPLSDDTIAAAGSVLDTLAKCVLLNETYFGNPEYLRVEFERNHESGRLNAPTGDPAYDLLRHELAHLRAPRELVPEEGNPRYQESVRRRKAGTLSPDARFDRRHDYSTWIEARAFGFLFEHFVGFKNARALPVDMSFEEWIDQLDGYSRHLIPTRAEDARFRPDGQPGVAEPSLGDRPVFNPREALAESNLAFGNSAPADFTHPVYALQALLRGVPVAQVWREVSERTERTGRRDPVPTASGFHPSTAPDGVSARLAQMWRELDPDEQAGDGAEDLLLTSVGRDGRQHATLDELARLVERQRAERYGTTPGSHEAAGVESLPGFAEWEHPPSGELGQWTHHISLVAGLRAELLQDVRQMLVQTEGLAELLDLGEWAASGASPAYLDVGELSDRILDAQSRPGIDSETADNLHALLDLLDAIEQHCESLDSELTIARARAEQVAVRDVADSRGGLRLGPCARIVDSARVEVFEGSGRYSVLPGALFDSLREQGIATVTRQVRVDPTGRVLVEQLPEPVHTSIERRQDRLWELCAAVDADTGTSNRLPPEWGARIAAVQARLARTAAVRARLFPARVDPHRITAADESRQRKLLERMESLTARLSAFRQEAEAERLTALVFSGVDVFSGADVTSPISAATNSARATLRADIEARSAVEAARAPELLALLRDRLVPRVMADAEELKWNARPRPELITAITELTEALEDVNHHQSELSPPQDDPDMGTGAEPPAPPADIDYAVRAPIAPGFYNPAAVRGATTDTIRRPTVAGGLFIGQDGKPYTTNGEEYFLIGADPDDIRTVNYGEVREAMRSLFAPHAVLLSTYADLADGPIIWGYWRITKGVLKRSAFTSGTLLDGEADLDILLKHAAYYRHWLRARNIDPSGIEVAAGTLQGHMWRPWVDGPVPSVRELFEQGGSRARAVFAACGDGFWVSVGAVAESPGRISVPLTINLLGGGTQTFTWEFTRADDTYTARISASEPAAGAHTAELATAFATLHTRVTAPWLAASEVLVEAPGEGDLWSADDPKRTTSPGPPRTSAGPSGKLLAEATNRDRRRSASRLPATSALDIRPNRSGPVLHRVQEAQLAAYLYHRPEVEAAAVAVLDRLWAVIDGLFDDLPAPDRDERIRAVFGAVERPRWGGMVLGSVPMEELRRDGNLRELMSAALNAMIRNAELGDAAVGVTLDQGIARLLNHPSEEWRRRRGAEIGLDVEALEAVRASVLGNEQHSGPITWKDLGDVQYVRIHDDVADAAFAEYSRRQEAFPARTEDEPQHNPTSADFAELGMPLSLREFAALPERKVLRVSRSSRTGAVPRLADGRVDVPGLTAVLKEHDSSVEYVKPVYEFDLHGRRIRDQDGNCRVRSIKVYHHEGYVDAAQAYRLDHSERVVELPWRPGFVYADPAHDSDYLRALIEQRIPSNAGISGTAARLLTRFRWLRPPGVSEHDFIAAMLAFMLPYHHTLYEFVRGLEMVGVQLGDDLESMYRTVLALFGPGDRAPAVSAAERRPATTPWQSKVPKGTADPGLASESAPTPWSAGQRDAGSPRRAEDSAATDPGTPASAASTPRRSTTTRPGDEPSVSGTALEIPEHIRLCLVQTVRAAWAIGYDDAVVPADDAETWKDLTDSLHAAPTRVTVPEGSDPRAAVAGILDMLEDPGNDVEAVAFVIDTGTRAHSFLATSEGRGRTSIFDTTIRAPRGETDDEQPVRRTPRVRDRATWERDFPRTFPHLEDLFSLDFVRDGGRLRPAPDTDRAGPTDEQRRHLIHGEPGSTPDPAEEPVTTRKLFVVNKPFINLLLGTPALPGGEVGNKLGSVAASYAVPYALMNAGQSPAVAALAGAGAWLPRLLDPHAGRVADRSDRRRVMLWAQGIGAGAAAAMTGLIFFDAPHLGVGVTAATLVEATAAAYYFRAFQAVTGDFLTAAQRPAANDLRNLTGSTAEATGQALGPGLVGMIPAGPFALNLLSYLTNFENVRRLSFPRQTFGEPRSLFRDIGEGARALWQEKFLREYTAIGTLNNAAWAMMGFRTATVLEASDLPGWATGAVVAAPAVGGMMSGVLSKMTRNVEATTFYPVALANMAGFFALQAATTNPAVIASATFADSLLMWALNSRIASYEMGAFPSEIRGRAGGVKGLFLGAGPAAGMFAASALVGGAAANVHSGDALAALAATISAVTAAGYAVVLFVRKGQVFYRIVTRGRGLFGRRASTAGTEPAPTSSQAPDTELVENCAKYIGRVHRALGAPARPPAPDHAAAGAVEIIRELGLDADHLVPAAGEIIRDLDYETDPRWDDQDNWRITEEVLGAQLRPMKTRGADPIATAVEIIRDGKNRIDRAAVTVDGHIHYIVAVEGLDGRDQILVFDSLAEDITVGDTEIALRVRNADGDENGDNKWQPSYTSYRKAFAAYFTTEGGVAVPARRDLAGFLPRRHPVQLHGRSGDAEDGPEATSRRGVGEVSAGSTGAGAAAAPRTGPPTEGTVGEGPSSPAAGSSPLDREITGADNAGHSLPAAAARRVLVDVLALLGYATTPPQHRAALVLFARDVTAEVRTTAEQRGWVVPDGPNPHDRLMDLARAAVRRRVTEKVRDGVVRMLTDRARDAERSPHDMLLAHAVARAPFDLLDSALNHRLSRTHREWLNRRFGPAPLPDRSHSARGAATAAASALAEAVLATQPIGLEQLPAPDTLDYQLLNLLVTERFPEWLVVSCDGDLSRIHRVLAQQTGRVSEYWNLRFLHNLAPEQVTARMRLTAAEADSLRARAESELLAAVRREAATELPFSPRQTTSGTRDRSEPEQPAVQAGRADLARAAGVSQQTVIALLSGKRVAVETWRRVVEAAARIGYVLPPEVLSSKPEQALSQEKLARAAGLSQATVNAVLNGRRVGVETWRRVVEAADRIGFVLPPDVLSAEPAPKVRQLDLARAAGVSPATVSAMMHGKHVGVETWRRVVEAAELIGFVLPREVAAFPGENAREAGAEGRALPESQAGPDNDAERGPGVPPPAASPGARRTRSKRTTASSPKVSVAEELAPIAKVSVGSVSRVLNGEAVSDWVRRRIVAAAGRKNVELPPQASEQAAPPALIVRIAEFGYEAGVPAETVARFLNGEKVGELAHRQIDTAAARTGFALPPRSGAGLLEPGGARTGGGLPDKARTGFLKAARRGDPRASAMLWADSRYQVLTEVLSMIDYDGAPPTEQAGVAALGRAAMDDIRATVESRRWAVPEGRTLVDWLHDLAARAVERRTAERIQQAAVGLLETVDPESAVAEKTSALLRGLAAAPPTRIAEVLSRQIDSSSRYRLRQRIGLRGSPYRARPALGAPDAQDVAAAVALAEAVATAGPVSPGATVTPRSTRRSRLDECLDRTAELITLRARREGDDRRNDWRKLRTDLGARLIDASGPADPLQEIIDRVKDPANDIHTTVVLVDEGETMHAFQVTAVGDTAIFFDTNIDHRTNPNLTAADREFAEQDPRIPRVQTENEFRNRFTNITGIFKAEYAEDPATGALEDFNRDRPENAEATTPREGEITGPPRVSEHSGEADGDSGLTEAQAETLRALTETENPHGTDGGHRLWLLPDPRGENPEAKVVVRRAIVADDTDPLAVVGDLLHVIPAVDEGVGSEVPRPRTLYRSADFTVHEQIAGTPVTMADLVNTDMSFRGDIAEQLFAQQAAGEPPMTSTAEWEAGLRLALRSAETKIAGLHPGSMLGTGTGLLGLPALSEVFPPNRKAGADPRPVHLRGTVTLADLVRTADGTFARQGSARPDLGPPAWAYAAFLIRNPWPPEVRPQVHLWCREQALQRYGPSTAVDFDRYVAVEARIAAVGRALQAPRNLAAHSVRNSDLLSTFTSDVAFAHRIPRSAPSESECQSALDLLADRIARGWPTTPGRYLVPEIDEPLPPRLGVPVRRLDRADDAAIRPLRQQNGTHRLEVHRFEGSPSSEGGLRMQAVVMIGQAEFGDLTISFEFDGDGDLVASVEPGPASEFVPEYRSFRGGADRGSFLDLVRHFVRGAGADVLRIRVADDLGGAVLHGEDLLRQAGFESAGNAGQWLTERCAWVPAAAEPVPARLDRRLTPSQVLQVMEQVRVTSPHESENQCGVWHLPLPGAPGSDSEPMVTVRVYLEEAQQLGFDLDTTVLSASETSDLFHQAGVGGPRSLYDSETFSFAPNFRTRVTIHEYVSGREVTPDEGWERTTEDTFAELYRLHKMTSPMTQRQWDGRQQARMIELEQDDVDHRLDQLIGGVPLFVLWKMTLFDEPEGRMGYTHGNPIRRKMRRGADGRIGFTDAKLAQYGPIAWDWARYYLVNDWADDAEREAVAAEIRTNLYRYGAETGAHLVADFHRYLLLEARKSIIGDAYRLPRKIATGLLTVEEALPAFHRNINLVRLAAGQDSMSEDAVRELLLEWSLRTLMPDQPPAERTEQPVAPAVAPRRWIQQFLVGAQVNFGQEHFDRDPTALRFVQRWDGPPRLEPTRVRAVNDTLMVTAAATRGTRMSEERHFAFARDDSGRIVADYFGGSSTSRVDGLVLDFVRDAGADRLRGYFSDFAAAARAGFDWNRAHRGEMAAVCEVLTDELDQLERREPALPAPVAEIQRRLRAGTVPTPRELLEAGLIDLGVDLDRISEAWLLCIDVASAQDTTWREPDVTPDRVAPADPAPAPETLFATIEREGAGTMEWEVAARQFLRARLRAPDWQGNNKRVWLFHDENGNRIVVHQLVRAATDDKDLTRNPTSAEQDIRWYHRLAFDVADAVGLAADATEVPARVYRWRDFYVEEFAEGRTPATTDDN
ncbi:LuxR C-terminal-related transcriptional regulator, partial [Nocardia rhamnosiphila]